MLLVPPFTIRWFFWEYDTTHGLRISEKWKLFIAQGTTSMTLKFNYPFCGRLGKRFEGLVLHEVTMSVINHKSDANYRQPISSQSDFNDLTFVICFFSQLFHALGLIHTQARPDRNDYIQWVLLSTFWKLKRTMKINISVPSALSCYPNVNGAIRNLNLNTPTATIFLLFNYFRENIWVRINVQSHFLHLFVGWVEGI